MERVCEHLEGMLKRRSKDWAWLTKNSDNIDVTLNE